MLDASILEQLKSHFANLKADFSFRLYKSEHPKQSELKEMLSQLTSTSPKISLDEAQDEVKGLRFDLNINQEASGISFRGIPGGHEFTSLILAILNGDGKGKLPDAGILNRITALKGPISVSTYVSLSCENCPEVVQALNVFALLHSDFSHEMVDGEIFTDEVESLKLGGVPAVVVDGELFHSGKASLSQLLDKLEAKFGVVEDGVQTQDLGKYDLTIVGAGPAGISAAIYGARKGLKTAIIADKIGGQVQETKGIENLISVIYTEGPQLSSQLEKHAREYDIDIFEHRRVSQVSGNSAKEIQLSSGESLQSSSVLVATGAKWRELNIPGEKEYLGRGVAYCPHCDGPYYKGKKVAVVGGGNSGVEAAIDLAGICKEVVLFEFLDELKADQVLVDKLKSLSNVTIITSAQCSELLGNGDHVETLKYKDRQSGEELQESLDGVFVQIGLSPNSNIGLSGLELNQAGEIVTDEKGRTNIKGVYAAGDVTTTPYKQIVISMGEGAKAALAVFEDHMLGH